MSGQATRLAASLVVAISLAACGSTVAQTSTAGQLSPGLDGAAAGTGTTSAAQGGTSPGSASTARETGPSGTTVSGGTTGTAPASRPGTSSVTAPALPTSGKTISVGIPYLDQQQTNTFTSSFGTGLEGGDDKANFQFLIDDLNKQGGILGRKIVPVFHRIDFSESQAQYEQETCTDFTQDHRVPFVLNGNSATLTKCLVDRGVGVLGDGSQVNTRDYETMRTYVQPGSFALDRLAALQASEFTRMGLFAGKTPARVGVLYYDQPTYHYAEQVLVKGLKQRGIQVAVEEGFHYAASTQDLGQTQAQVQAAVLKFKANGVTHVVGVELNAWLQGFFALYADQQDYYPRYGWTSNQVPTNVMAVVPHKALINSLLLGFYPTYDTGQLSEYPAETLRCFHQLAAHGVKVTTGNQRSSAAVDCDAVRYLKLALTAGRGVTPAALVTGARALQHTFAPAVTYGSFLPKGYGAGGAAMRLGAWSTSCDCFAYTSKPFPVG